MNKMSRLFKALSDANRLRVISSLTNYEEICACQFIELLQVTGATVSAHLRILIHAGLVKSRKDGKRVFYRLNQQDRAYAPLLDWLKTGFIEEHETKKDLKRLNQIMGQDMDELCRKQRGERCCPSKGDRE